MYTIISYDISASYWCIKRFDSLQTLKNYIILFKNLRLGLLFLLWRNKILNQIYDPASMVLTSQILDIWYNGVYKWCHFINVLMLWEKIYHWFKTSKQGYQHVLYSISYIIKGKSFYLKHHCDHVILCAVSLLDNAFCLHHLVTIWYWVTLGVKVSSFHIEKKGGGVIGDIQ